MRHFVPLNLPAMQAVSTRRLETGCGAYTDAPVCEDGSNDVHCNDRYRGCHPGAWDCADCATPNDNNDDGCCWGGFPGPADNIDHGFCATYDAQWGGWCLWEAAEGRYHCNLGP
jgi:hypothetical protein